MKSFRKEGMLLYMETARSSLPETTLADALSQAYKSGERNGIEKAAKVAEDKELQNEYPAITQINIAKAIRQLNEEK